VVSLLSLESRASLVPWDKSPKLEMIVTPVALDMSLMLACVLATSALPETSLPRVFVAVLATCLSGLLLVPASATLADLDLKSTLSKMVATFAFLEISLPELVLAVLATKELLLPIPEQPTVPLVLAVMRLIICILTVFCAVLESFLKVEASARPAPWEPTLPTLELAVALLAVLELK